MAQSLFGASAKGVRRDGRAERVGASAIERHAAPRTSFRFLISLGRDDPSGPGFLVVHQPEGASTARLAMVRIQLGGAAPVTPRALTTSAADAVDARDLALVVARHHAEAMVADPSLPAAARLEVALRTRWAQSSALEAVAPEESAVGFDPATEAHQLALMGVWGDNAVFVTFAKDGALRVEDVN